MLNSGYMLAIDGCSRQALSDAVKAIIAGRAKGISKAFCPRPPELGALVREKQAELDALIDRETSAERLAEIAANRPKTAQRPSIVERAAAERQRMRDEGRVLLFTVPTFEAYLSRRREIPTGGKFVSSLGEAYGPAGVVKSEGDDEGLPLHP